MDLIEDLNETEILTFQTFLKTTGVTMLDKSAAPIDKLKQLTVLLIMSCKHGHILDDIIHKLELKVLCVAYVAKHKHLFCFSNWPISVELVSAVEEAKIGKISNSMKEISRGIFMLEILPVEFCVQLLEEITNFEIWCYNNKLFIDRPNSMNKFGAILDQFGFQTVFNELTEFLRPLFILLFGEDNGNVESHHGFAVEYELGKDVNLGFHVDDAQATLNLCLGSDFTGGDIWFSGVRCPSHVNTATTKEEYFIYKHKPGFGIFHLGKHRHGALDILSGKRSNLIVWFRNETERDREREYSKNRICPYWCWYGRSEK